MDSYVINIALAILTSFTLSLVAGSKLIAMLSAFQLKQSVRAEGPKSHLKKTGTPTMGGLLILFAANISTLIWCGISMPRVWACLIILNIFGLLGLYDDLLKIKYKNSKGISAKFKFSAQVITTIVTILLLRIFYPDLLTLSIYIPIVNSVLFLGSIYFIWSILVVVGSSNAVNLTDGLDGLASSQVILICFGLIALTLINSQVYAPEVGVFLGALLGSCMGFLWFNSHPALVFMGDVGSLALGGSIGFAALLVKQELLFAMISLVLIAETISVIIQVISFRLRKKRVFLMAPLHHHFELKGWSETKVVARLWLITLLLITVALPVIIC